MLLSSYFMFCFFGITSNISVAHIIVLMTLPSELLGFSFPEVSVRHLLFLADRGKRTLL
jgi:hypothetical protein